MLDERLLDYDPSTGLKTWFSSSDDDGGTWNVRYEQDASSLLDANKSAQADSWDKKSEMWHAASVPTIVMYEWAHKFGVEMWNPAHKDGVRKLLNHPDYRYLRVRNFII